MNKRLAFLSIAAGTVLASAPLEASDDWQWWNQLVFRHEMTDTVDLTVATEQKFSDDFSDFYLYNVTVVPTVDLAKGVSVGAGYRREIQECDDGDWTVENRLLVPLTLGWTVAPWTVRLRNQLEYRDLETTDRWRLRERITLAHPIRLGETAVEPFVSGEAFYDFTDERVNQSRFSVGVSVPWTKHISLALFYMHRADKDDDWSSTNILGTDVVFRF